MKEKECKLPIQEDHKNFLQKPTSESSGNKKIAIVAVVLLLTAMSLMTAFTFQSINGISELKQEVDYLKAAVKVLQKKLEENQQDVVKDATSIRTSDDPTEIFGDYEYDIEDYPSYENYDNLEYEDENSSQPLTGENYTKDAKQDNPSRTKRSIIGYSQDGTPINSEEYGKKDTKRNYRGSTPPPSSYSSYPFYPELKTHQNVEETTPGQRQIYSRRLHVYQDNQDQSTQNSEVEFVVGDGHTRHRQRRLEFDDRHVRPGRMKPLPVAHFSGDTSKYVLGQHDNFKGNGHLSHPHRIFVDWSESSWFHTLGMDRHFGLADGVVTIKEAGLYFIYAQIYYYDEHDVNGFRVHRNDNETLLQCTTTTHSVDRVLKGNTCFTAAAEYLNENDKISIGDISQSRYSLFEPGKSFFGVIKLGDVKIK